jgi:hypothetical protein
MKEVIRDVATDIQNEEIVIALDRLIYLPAVYPTGIAPYVSGYFSGSVNKNVVPLPLPSDLIQILPP